MSDGIRYYPEERMAHGTIPYVMGTFFDLLFFGKTGDESAALWRGIRQLLLRLDNMMNRFAPDSEVSAVNRDLKNGTASLSDELATAVGLSLGYTARTEGLFDITRSSGSLLRLEGTVLECGDRGADLDFGGFAKGWALKRIAGLMEEAGVRQAFADFGGSSILAVGTHPYGDCWKVSMRNGTHPEEFSLRDCAMSVSGNSPGYSGHIINPVTGEKVETDSVAVAIGPDALDVEILSTVMLVADDGLRKMIGRNFPSVKITML